MRLDIEVNMCKDSDYFKQKPLSYGTHSKLYLKFEVDQ